MRKEKTGSLTKGRGRRLFKNIMNEIVEVTGSNTYPYKHT
jgi:hypothetical protein